jgi:hypothetical protein
MKIETPGQMGAPTNNQLHDEPTSTPRRFYIDHRLFNDDPWYRRLLAWRIGAYLVPGSRLHLSFKCSGDCCQLDSPRSAANFLLGRKYADAWLRQA